MLSLTYIKPEQSVAYYNVLTQSEAGRSKSPEHAHYYTEKAGGKWQGKGAQHLGLRGTVLKTAFENLLHGNAPDGAPLVQPGQNLKHRAGYDYTFSAPKSFSIITELLASGKLKKDLTEAHTQAVQTTLAYLENKYATARITKNGGTRTVHTGNLVYATFPENTSREHDPQIHTHVVIFNITKRADGQFRAIMNEPLHRYKMFLGQMYRNELAKRLRELGFELDLKSKGLFEIKGVSEDVRKEFSTRSERIEERMEALRQKYPHMPDVKLRELAAVETRGKKQTVSIEQLQDNWQERLSHHNKNPEKLLKSIMKQTPVKTNCVNHIDLALQILTEEESVVTKEHLMHTALKLSLGEKTMPDLERDLQQSKEIRTLQKDRHYTSKEIQLIERDIVKQIEGNRNAFRQRFSRQAWLRLLPQRPFQKLTNDQKKALEFILTGTNDQTIAVQGDAGTGKTTMLKLAAEQYTRIGYEVVTLAPTARAVDELAQKKLPNPQTIARYLLSPKMKPQKKPRLYIVDEASMLGSRKFKEILERSKPADKIVLVGDSKQKQSIEQGGIFSKLQEYRVIKTIRMQQNVRQKDHVIRQTVNQLAEKNIVAAFATLTRNDKVRVIEDSFERLNIVADEFLRSYPKKNVLVVIETNAERRQLNDLIRQKLRASHRISRKSTTLTVSQPRNIPAAERHLSANYASGDFFFLRKKLQGIPAGSQGKIKKANHSKNKLKCEVVSKGLTKSVTLDLSRHAHNISAYTKDEKKFSKGDKIIFLKNDKKIGVENGTTGKIRYVSKYQMKVVTDNGKRISFNPRTYPFFDLGYAATNYKVQGMTAQQVLYVADTRNHLDFNSLYVAASRATENLYIYTNDREQLLEKVQIEQFKTSTLDYARQGLERELSREQEL